MELIRALSKTEQVANALRDEIRKRNLPTGTRLASSRELAKRFGTSKRVVEDAFKVLSDEGMIHKRARSGVFVNKPHPVSHLKEVYILGVGVQEGEKYFNEILKLASSSSLLSDFTFLVRIYPPEISISTVLDIESVKVSKMSELDCILISGVNFSPEEAKRCLDFPKPVIFIGDFSSIETDKLELNQVMTDNALQGERAVKQLKRMGVRKAILFNGSSEHLFNKQYIDAACESAQKLSMDLTVVEFPKGISAHSEEERSEICERVVSKALQNGKRDFDGAIINAVDKDSVGRALRKLFPKLAKQLKYPPDYASDFDVFRKRIIERINEIVEKRDSEYKKIRVSLPVLDN